jgi:hypothetical protein
MYTAKMAHDDPAKRACWEKVRSDGLLSSLNSGGHASKFLDNMFIYVYVSSAAYDTCKTVMGANSED